jgi:hypothetical protein
MRAAPFCSQLTRYSVYSYSSGLMVSLSMLVLSYQWKPVSMVVEGKEKSSFQGSFDHF